MGTPDPIRMSASPTTIPAVKAKLVELFKSAVDTSTEVWPARPTEDHQLAENIYIGKVKGARRFVTLSPSASSNSREEEYEVLVEVEVFREGTDIEGTEARMWEIAQAAELAIAEHRALDGLNSVQWAISGHFEQDTRTGEDGVLAPYVFGVSITARI